MASQMTALFISSCAWAVALVHHMEASGHLHTPAILPPEKESLIPTGHETWSAAGSVYSKGLLNEN